MVPSPLSHSAPLLCHYIHAAIPAALFSYSHFIRAALFSGSHFMPVDHRLGALWAAAQKRLRPQLRVQHVHARGVIYLHTIVESMA